VQTRPDLGHPPLRVADVVQGLANARDDPVGAGLGGGDHLALPSAVELESVDAHYLGLSRAIAHRKITFN
jgi:hypothetical protein